LLKTRRLQPSIEHRQRDDIAAEIEAQNNLIR
jgi:hypothetical protein